MDERNTKICNRAEAGLLYNLFLVLCCKWLVARVSHAKLSVQTGFMARFRTYKEKHFVCAAFWDFCSPLQACRYFFLNGSLSILHKWPLWSLKRLQRVQTTSRTDSHSPWCESEVPKLNCSTFRFGFMWNITQNSEDLQK